MSETPGPPDGPRKPSAVVRAVVDYAGLAAFMLGYLVSRNLVAATGALVAGSVLALLVGFALERRVAPLPLFSGVTAVLFGGLTLLLHDKTFVKIKLTVVDLLLAGVLLFGLVSGRNLLKLLLGEQLPMTDAGWRRVTVRYMLFFVAMAVLNEVLRRAVSDGAWLLFRAFGVIGLTVLFSLTQVPLMMKEGRAMEAAARAVETQE